MFRTWKAAGFLEAWIEWMSADEKYNDKLSVILILKLENIINVSLLFTIM